MTNPNLRPVDYPRIDDVRRRHHERYVRRVQKMKRPLVCQECGGGGDYVDEYIDFGDSEVGGLMYPRYEQCGWCEGTGRVLPHTRGVWLRYRRECKRGVLS